MLVTFVLNITYFIVSSHNLLFNNGCVFAKYDRLVKFSKFQLSLLVPWTLAPLIVT